MKLNTFNSASHQQNHPHNPDSGPKPPSPRRNGQRAASRGKGGGEQGDDEFEEFNMRNESLKYNQRVSQNISKLIVGKEEDQAGTKALTYGPRYKRNKSADPFSAVGAVAANKAICERSNSGSRGRGGE